jgi:hypothetical protein
MKSFLLYAVVLFAIVMSTSLLRAQDTTATKDTTNYKMQEIVVNASQPVEEHLVGEYKQPEWSTHRRFPSTRVYLQVEPGEVEYEQWAEIYVNQDNNANVNQNGSKLMRLESEFEFGLGGRFQFDIYMNTLRQWNPQDGAGSNFGLRGWSSELRYAFANWGEIPGNPTLYLEYSVFDSTYGDEGQGYDKIEGKLLLGDQFGPRWHWGWNIVHERSLAPADYRDMEFTTTAGISYTAVDEKFSLGPEISATDEIDRPRTAVIAEGAAGDIQNYEILIGPSFQFRPQKRAHFDVEPLFGVTPTSHAMRMIMIFGWDL